MSVRFQTRINMSDEDKLTMFHARKLVFIDQYGWDIPTYDGGPFEMDQYDHERALYCTGYEGIASRYSVRLLDRDDCMVKDLWPAFLEYIPQDAIEVSRFVTHGTKSLRFNRASIELFHYSLRMKGNRPDFFAVATEKMARAFSIALDWTPTQVLTIDAYPDLRLLLWLQD
jgi:N-acyl-L-homoserine lactone synthetase